MSKPQLSLLGSLLTAGVVLVAGCGGGGGGGAGGATGAGTGGATDAGTGGATDAGTGGAAGAGTGGVTTTIDAAVDASASADTGGDARTDSAASDRVADAGPCTTSFGAGNRLLFAFTSDPATGWAATVETDPANWGLTTSLSLGGVTTDGDACPGALTLTLPFTAGGAADAGGQAQIALRYIGYYNNTLDWTGYSKLHMSVKVVSSSYAALSSIQAYANLITTTSPTEHPYPHFDTGPLANSDWHRVVIDLSGESPVTTRLTELGVRIQLNAMAPPGGPAAPPTLEVRLDDIWLEAGPAGPDAGSNTAPDAAADAPSD